jgi:hypothetical protein
MTAKSLASISFVLVSCITGFLVLGNQCPAGNPAEALAGYFMMGAHFSNAPMADSSPTRVAEPPAAPVIAEARRGDLKDAGFAKVDFSNPHVMAVVVIVVEHPHGKPRKCVR